MRHSAAQAGCASTFGDVERLVQVRQRVLLPVDDDEQAADAQRGERVLVAVAERPGQLERALGRRERGDGAFGQPLLPGEGDQGPDEPPVITVLLPELGGRCRRRRRKMQLVAVGQRPRIGLAESSPPGRRQPVSAGQDLGVAGRRLRVRADARGLPRRRLAVRDDGVVVAGLHRMVQDPERIAVRAREKSAQHVRVQFQPDTGRQRCRDGATGEFVPEGDDVTTDFHDAGALGLRDRGQVADQDAQQAHPGAGRYDRQPVQGTLSRRAQGAHPGQHRVNDRRWHDRTRVGQHLGDVERIAAGEPEQLAGIDVG